MTRNHVHQANMHNNAQQPPRSTSGAKWKPGDIVRARGRDWLILSDHNKDVIVAKPMCGWERHTVPIWVDLELVPIVDSSFKKPEAWQETNHESALMLRDALVLALRRCAGPFRSFGHIAIEPRAYQMVPLLMALKQTTIRLLIADDVGAGKTIEAGLILSELMHRGDVERFSILCPPHLVDQWASELENCFHIKDAVIITTTSVMSLERKIPDDCSVFQAHPHTIVSLDYIKNEPHCDDFIRHAPPVIIVDEAHVCTSTGDERHKRFEILQTLASDNSRHLIMITAMPHSGDDSAYYRLLSLINPQFAKLETATGEEYKKLRDRLSEHIVQRRRVDLADWSERRLFPQRQNIELTYRLKGKSELFFNDVLDYCAKTYAQAGDDPKRQRMSYWATLALMRCVASSPAAAEQALQKHGRLYQEVDEEEIAERILDGSHDTLPNDDVVPAISPEGIDIDLLVARAAELRAAKAEDPKLNLLLKHVKELLDEGFHPVVFCRYIATVNYVGDFLQLGINNVSVTKVSGENSPNERKYLIENIGDKGRRVLVCTDCLSEGINLQDYFDAVVHYDLSWNPTRHEQREGRIDRFGQEHEIVRTTMMYGANNPVDGVVLEAILKKAAKIREELGIPVPLPEDGHELTSALLRAMLLKRGGSGNDARDSLNMTQIELAIDKGWRDAADKVKKSRSVLTQHCLKPEEVIHEYQKAISVIGGKEVVKRFVLGAMARMNSTMEPTRDKFGGYKANFDALYEDIKRILFWSGHEGTMLMTFEYPSGPNHYPIQRSHPITTVLAEVILGRTISEMDRNNRVHLNVPGELGRVGCWIASSVSTRTIVMLLRIRHQLTTIRNGVDSTTLVEEATAISFQGTTTHIEGNDAFLLLSPPPVGEPPRPAWERAAKWAVKQINERLDELNAYAKRRAEALLHDHMRVRGESDAFGRHEVKALLPPDIIGVYVLLPKV